VYMLAIASSKEIKYFLDPRNILFIELRITALIACDKVKALVAYVEKA